MGAGPIGSINMNKRLRRFVNALRDRARLNYDRGKRIPTYVSRTPKVRRHSGRQQARISGKMPLDWLRENCFEDNEYWDDWNDFRDGFRNCMCFHCKRDKVYIIKKINKQIQVRRVRNKRKV